MENDDQLVVNRGAIWEDHTMKVALRKRQRKGSKKEMLFLDYRLNGKRTFEYIGISYDPRNVQDKKAKKLLAENIRAKRELDLNNSEHGFIPHFKKKANYIEYFKRLAEEKNDKAWKHTLIHLTKYTGGSVQFFGITEEWLDSFKNYLLTTAGLSKNTSGTYFAKVKASLNQAVRDKIILASPALLVKQIPKADVKKVFLSIDELGILATAPCGNSQIKLAFLFSCYTGLRISDIKCLEWGHVQGNRIEIVQKKTKESLYLNLCDMAIEILKRVKGNILPLPMLKIFPDLPSEISINRCLKRMALNTGINKNISFHTSRHTFATMSLTVGVDIYTVSKLLGHTDIKNTQIYAKVIDQKMMDAVKKLPKICIK